MFRVQNSVCTRICYAWSSPDIALGGTRVPGYTASMEIRSETTQFGTVLRVCFHLRCLVLQFVVLYGQLCSQKMHPFMVVDAFITLAFVAVDVVMYDG